MAQQPPESQELQDQQPATNLVLNVIRTETALRYPMHNLSTGEPITIEVRRSDAEGGANFVWEVTYNNKYGQPGRLAYKLDTVVINRRIDEFRSKGQLVPKMLRLGSLREIAGEVGTGEGNTNAVKRALRQNAFAGLTVRGLHYKTSDRSEQTFEFSDTRYGIVFTGEKLPDGNKADSVYVVFHDLYLALLNSAMRRPLDYDYLKQLSPTEQRFYEILSYQMVSAVKYKQRAKLRYSEYCQLSTQVRHFELRRVRDQMRVVHRPHIVSGYIQQDPEFQECADEQGRPDWFIYYVPGSKAEADQLAFDHIRGLTSARREQGTKQAKPVAAGLVSPAATGSAGESGLGGGGRPATIQEQLAFHVLEGDDQNRDSVADNSGSGGAETDDLERLARHFYQLWSKSGQHALLTAGDRTLADELLRSYSLEEAKSIVEHCVNHARTAYPALNTFGGARSMLGIAIGAFHEKRQERERSKQRQTAKALEDAREAHRARFQAEYGKYLEKRLKALQKANPGLYAAYQTQKAEERARLLGSFFKPESKIGQKMLKAFDSPEQEAERLARFYKKDIPDFWAWDATLNPEAFRETKK